MEKKKSNKGVIVALIILIIIVLALSSYVVYDKFLNTENDKEITENNEKKENKTEEVLPEKNTKYTYADMIKKDIILNNKKHTLLTYYYKENGNKVEGEGQEYDSVRLYKEVYLDNKKILEPVLCSIYAIDDLQDKSNIATNDYESFNEQYIYDYENNKQYLVYPYTDTSNNINAKNIWYNVHYDCIIIVDEDGNVLDKVSNKDQEKTSLWFELNNSKKSSYQNRTITDIDNNKFRLYNVLGAYTYFDLFDFYSYSIYYIDTTNIDFENKGYFRADTKFPEYKITIKDGKVNKEKVNEYTSSEINGSM